MTSARKQAREAAVPAWNSTMNYAEKMMAVSDAASDVWEPLTAKLKIACRTLIRAFHEGDSFDLNLDAIEDLLSEADEATQFNPFAPENLWPT